MSFAEQSAEMGWTQDEMVFPVLRGPLVEDLGIGVRITVVGGCVSGSVRLGFADPFFFFF